MIETRRRPRSEVVNLPLLQETDFTYLGSFRLPWCDGRWGYVSDRGGLAFDATTGHLWAHEGYGVFEFAIPDLVATTDPLHLPEATLVQPVFDPSEGHLYTDIGSGDAKLGGILVHQDKLILASYIYFDANNAARKSHFQHAKDGTQASYAGLTKVGADPKTCGWVSKYMAPIPAEWQAALGGVAITGGASLPIQSRLPYGFSAGVFNPDDIDVVDPVPVFVVQGQPSDHQTWGPWDGHSEMWNANAWVNNVCLIAGTRTAIWCGAHGIGPFCYGSPGIECTDPEQPHHGYHGYPYRYQHWLIDMYEWAEVKAGHRQPWDVLPYAYYGVTYPFTSRNHYVIGCAYDPTECILYVMQSQVCGYDNSEPAVHGYRVNVPAAPEPPEPPDPPKPPDTDTSLETATVSALFHELGKRFAVTVPTPQTGRCRGRR